MFMAISIKKQKEAYDILEKYDGNNKLLNSYKYFVFEKKTKTLNGFECDFILRSHSFKTEKINKTFGIARWYGEKQKEAWNVTFTPERVYIYDIMGETENAFYVSLKYRKSAPAIACFLPKKAILGDLRATDYTKMELDFEPIENKLSEIGYVAYEHQKTAVKFLLERKKCVLADDQGLGKTISAIMASILGEFKKILIICPASLKTNWEKEISNLVPEDRIGIVNGDDWVDKQYTIINFDIIDRHHKMPTTVVKSEVVDKKGNVKIKETVIKSRKKDVIQKAIEESSMCKANFDLVIIDEVHKLSDNKSIRYKVIEDFIVKSGIKNIYLMSGTPMTNRPMNLYHVLNLIKHPVTANYEYYVRSFCEGKQITNRHTGRKVWLTNGASNLDELKEIIKDSYLRRLKNDIPDMVDKVIYQRYYKLTDEQKIEYDNLWDEYKQSQLELGKTNLNRDLTEAILLRQFISDAMVENTIALTDEFIEDGEKVLIACCFNNEVANLKEYYGDKAVIYKGGMTIKQKDKAEHDFMNDKKKQVFIGNIQAAGVGLTLTSASICIFNSYDWVPGNNLQMMDRVHRIGQKDDVKVFYQLFTQTISERMWNTVMRKALNIDAVIKDEDEK